MRPRHHSLCNIALELSTQARNYLRDKVRKGDHVLYFHSSCKVPGVYGVAEVMAPAYPDGDALEPAHPLFDPKHTAAAPRWFRVDLTPLRALLVPLRALRAAPALADMALLRQPRLSVMPVTPEQWREVLRLADAAEPASGLHAARDERIADAEPVAAKGKKRKRPKTNIEIATEEG